ncbi:MAG: hypothetical protein L6306_08300, partial [Planctomycetales bacterium]|nr:hypothetical protein [Planctomycetales bacterium]
SSVVSPIADTTATTSSPARLRAAMRRATCWIFSAVATEEPQFVKELVQLKTNLPDGDKKKFSDRDELYESAIDVVVREGRGSVSLLQRALGIGYGRAARLIDFMAEDGIVGPYNGSQAREILVSLEQWEQMTNQADDQPATTSPPKPLRKSKIVVDKPEEEEGEEEEVDEEEPDESENDYEDEGEEDYDDEDGPEKSDEELEEQEEEEDVPESKSTTNTSQKKWRAESA